MTDDPWTIGRLLQWTIDYLGKHGADSPRLDAEVLLAKARGCQRIDLYAAYGEEASDALRATFRDLVSRRAKGMPVAYLVGHKEFYSLDFEVTPDTLIPRPETESLVVALFDHLKGQGARGLQADPRDSDNVSGNDNASGNNAAAGNDTAAASPAAALRVCDIGTGSGIVAICVAKYLPSVQVTAVDISSAALAVARRNAERHRVADRIEFVESDLFAALPTAARFDAIASNPPYITTAEMAELPVDVRDFEPHRALAAGPAGTDVISPLVAAAADRLESGGKLLLEVSPMIAPAVEKLIRANPAFTLGATLRDPAGLDRVIQAARN